MSLARGSRGRVGSDSRGAIRFPVIALVPLVVAIGALAYLVLRPAPEVDVSLEIRALMGDEPLALGAGRYVNPGGEGTFSIRDFQFFLSNVRLVAADGDRDEDGAFVEPESYHLARFDGDDGVFRVDIGPVPRRAYERLEFAIGVDSAANNSIAAPGDLDPNGRMAWGWDIGYKFVLVEGGLEMGDALVPLVYHVGFDENYTPISLALDDSAFEGDASAGGPAVIALCADLLRMFAGGASGAASEAIDMAQVSSVTTDGDDSRRLASNWADMVTTCPE